MRFIYIDEAGISAKEPMTVVVGVVVHADSQYGDLERELAAVVQAVPEPLRAGGFTSHVKKILAADKNIRAIWPLKQREQFVLSLLAIPSKLSLAVMVGFVSRSHPGDPAGLIKNDLDYHQVSAFGLCVAEADRFIRDFCGAYEVATVVAEDANHLKPQLRDIVDMLQRKNVSISRLKDTVHFAKKDRSPFLQVADACAYAISEFYKERPLGRELLLALGGGDERILGIFNDLRKRTSGSCRLFNPTHRSRNDDLSFSVEIPSP